MKKKKTPETTPITITSTSNIMLGLEQEKTIIAHAVKNNTPVLIIGDTGTGKTSLVKELAMQAGAVYRRLNLNGGTTADEFAGHYTLDGKGGMIWTNGVLIDAMINGYWLLLDEINTAQPDVLFYLHSLLDDDRTITLAEKNGETIKPHDNFRLFATMNGGHDYAGTRELNKALASRFGVVLQVTFAEPAEEEAILKSRHTQITEEHCALLVKIAGDLRKSYKNGLISYVCSTRDLISTAQLLVEGIDPTLALRFGIINRTQPETEERKAVEDIIKLHCGDLGTGKIASVEGMAKKMKQLEEEAEKAGRNFSEAISEVLKMFNLSLPSELLALNGFNSQTFKEELRNEALKKISPTN